MAEMHEIRTAHQGVSRMVKQVQTRIEEFKKKNRAKKKIVDAKREIESSKPRVLAGSECATITRRANQKKNERVQTTIGRIRAVPRVLSQV